MKNFKNVIKVIVMTFMIAVLFWIGISTIEVMCNNLKPNYEYHDANFWTVMMDMANDKWRTTY